MNFNEGELIQGLSGGVPTQNFFVFKNGQIRPLEGLDTSSFSGLNVDAGRREASQNYLTSLASQLGTGSFRQLEENNINDYSSQALSQGRLGVGSRLGLNDARTLLGGATTSTELPINPISRLSGQTNLPPQQFSNGVYQGTLTPEQQAQMAADKTRQQNAATQQPQQQPIQNTVPVPGAAPGAVSGPTAQPGAPLANQVETNQPQFVRNTTTGQIAQVVPGGLKGFGTPQEFAAAGGGFNSVRNISPQDFETFRTGGTVNAPTSGTANATTNAEVNAITGQPEVGSPEWIKNVAKEFGLNVGQEKDPYTEFFTNYKKIFADLGLPDFKTEVEKNQKAFNDLQAKKIEEIINIQNNPWMTQGTKDSSIAQINKNYELRENTLSNIINNNKSIYEQGIQQAQFISGRMLEISHQGQTLNEQLFAKAIDYAEKTAAREVKRSPIYQEYLDAKKEGYTGSFTKYQNEDANRKIPKGNVINNYLGVPGSGSGIDSYAQTSISGLHYVDSSQFQGKARDEAAKQAVLAGIPFISKEQAEAIQEIDNARLNQKDIIDQISPLLPHDAQGRIFGGALRNKLSQFLQTQDQIGAFSSWRTAAINTLRATAGSKGLRINQAEIQAAIQNDIPTLTDTVGVAQQKFKNIQKLLDNAEASILVKNRSSLGANRSDTNPNLTGLRKKYNY